MGNLTDIEIKLRSIRNSYELSRFWFNRFGLNHDVVKSIEEYGNYNIKNLFTFLDNLGYTLFVNDVQIDNIEDFGKYLRSLRKNKKLTIKQLSNILNCSTQQIVSVELGRGYYKSTLLKYLSVFKVDFTVNQVFVELGDYKIEDNG